MYSNKPSTTHLGKRKLSPNCAESPAKRPVLDIASYLRQGDEWVAQAKYESAIAAYSAALAIAPDGFSAYLKRSQAYERMGKREAAKRDCLHALWLNADDESLQAWLGQLVPADFKVQTFLDEQLVLFKELLLEPDDSPFVRYARAILSEDFNPDLWDSELRHRLGYNLLHLATCINDQTLVEALINRGARADSVNRRNYVSSLWIAAYANHLALVRFLIQQHVDVNLADSNGATPLYVAAQNGHLGVVKYLVEQGQADVNQACYFNSATPLYIAAYHGHLDVVKCLLAHLADVYQVCHEQMTPLHVASTNGHSKIGKQLIAYGALDELKRPSAPQLLTLKDKSDRTACDLAEPKLAISLQNWHQQRLAKARQVLSQTSNILFKSTYCSGLFNVRAQRLADCEIICSDAASKNTL